MSRADYMVFSALVAMAAFAAVGPVLAASSGSNDSFQIISERNIFDPGRGPTIEPPPPPQPVESLTLQGTMTYEGAKHAFFEGTSIAGQGQVLGPKESVAGCTIQEVVNGTVMLALPDGRLLALGVGDQMRRVGDGPWQISQATSSTEMWPTQPRNNRVNRVPRVRAPRQEATN